MSGWISFGLSNYPPGYVPDPEFSDDEIAELVAQEAEESANPTPEWCWTCGGSVIDGKCLDCARPGSPWCRICGGSLVDGLCADCKRRSY